MRTEDRTTPLMAALNVTTGCLFRPVTLTVALDEEGVDPEVLFQAANAIGTLSEDLANLPQGWPQRLRNSLHEHGAPSMSVGDFFTITVGDNELGGKQITLAGWEPIRVVGPSGGIR